MCSKGTGVMKVLLSSKQLVKYTFNDMFRNVCGLCILLSAPLPQNTGVMLNSSVGWKASPQALIIIIIIIDFIYKALYI